MQFHSDLLSEIKLYKDKTKINNSELEYFVQYLDQEIFKRVWCFLCMPCKVHIAPSFARAFETMNGFQKSQYYLNTLMIIFDFNKQTINTPSTDKDEEKIQMQFRAQSKLYKKSTVIINYKLIDISIIALGVKLKLQNYILRKSKSSNKHAFVLESIKAECQPVTLRLAHPKKEQFQRLFICMKWLSLAGLRKKISNIIGMKDKSRDYTNNWLERRQCLSVKLSNPINEQSYSIRRMLRDSKSMGSAQQIDTTDIVNMSIIQQMNNFQMYEQVTKGFFIHCTMDRIRKICVFDGIKLDWLVSELTNHQHFKIWKGSLLSVEVIGDVPKENTKFYYEINLYKDGSEVDYVYLRHCFVLDNTTYFMDKSITTEEYGSHETSGNRGKIQYIIWRIRHKNDQIQLLVQAEISHILCGDLFQAMNEQIGQIQNISLCANILQTRKRNIDESSFYSINDDGFSCFDEDLRKDSYVGVHTPLAKQDPENKSQYFTIADANSEEDQPRQSQISPLSRSMRQREIKIKKYRYKTIPQCPLERVYRQFRNSTFFDPCQCICNEIGDLVFTNEEKIKAQGSVIMNVVKRMGANLLSGKNVMNVSFPIQIFAAQTNLERLCKGMAYAPVFLQEMASASPLLRMKAAICFALGTLLLTIQMSKPFNPILGETYQAFIDGCPVYGEQISHHPPISSLFLVGRGYFVWGSIQPSVQLGINSVSGTNSGSYNIAFNNSDPYKNLVVFTSPPGELSGLIYGQRKLNITQKSQFYDAQNGLFCQINWGPNKNSYTVGRFHDYLEGRIVELHRSYSNISKVKQSDKDKILGYITGRWTQTVYFNSQAIFEVNKVRPFHPTNEKIPLPSDSRMRHDRKYVERDMFPEAQAANDRLEQNMREDRKLRKKLHQ